MVAIWSPETKFRIWFEIEAHAADAHGRTRRHPEGRRQEDLGQGQRRPTSTSPASTRSKREVKHDVIAFLTHLAEIVGPEARFVHSGHDLVRRARHLPQRAAGARRRPADRGRRRAARRAQAPRLRAQDDADDRPLARHPCRADHLRAQARLCLCGIRARQASGSLPRARKSRPARSPARSAPSPRSIRASKRMSPRRWA